MSGRADSPSTSARENSRTGLTKQLDKTVHTAVLLLMLSQYTVLVCVKFAGASVIGIAGRENCAKISIQFMQRTELARDFTDCEYVPYFDQSWRECLVRYPGLKFMQRIRLRQGEIFTDCEYVPYFDQSWRECLVWYPVRKFMHRII